MQNVSPAHTLLQSELHVSGLWNMFETRRHGNQKNNELKGTCHQRTDALSIGYRRLYRLTGCACSCHDTPIVCTPSHVHTRSRLLVCQCATVLPSIFSFFNTPFGICKCSYEAFLEKMTLGCAVILFKIRNKWRI